MESAARASRKSWRTSDQQLRVRDGKTKETEQDRVHGERRRDHGISLTTFLWRGQA